MITSRIPLDLSVARDAEVFTVNAVGIRFHRVPGPFSVRINSPTGVLIDVDGPFSYAPCGELIRHLYITNAAQAGLDDAVILVADTAEEFSNFLAGSSAGSAGSAGHSSDVVTSAVQLDHTGVMFDYIQDYPSNVGAASNVIMLTDAATQFHGTRFWAVAGAINTRAYFIRDRYAHNWLAYRHAPGGRVRAAAMLGDRYEFMEAVLAVDLVAGPTGAMWTLVGWFNQTAPYQPWNFGVGFVASYQTNNNWHAAVLNRDPAPAGAFPTAAQQLVWIDTGISSITDFRRLRLKHGLLAGIPFVEWLIDGVVVHRHDGPFSAFLDPASTFLGECVSIYHAAAADSIRAWLPEFWIMGYGFE